MNPYDPEEAVWTKIQAERLMGLLLPRERRIIEAQCYGFTLEEVAREEGLCRQSISQIAAKAHRIMYSKIWYSDKKLEGRLEIPKKGWDQRPTITLISRHERGWRI